MFNPEVAKTLIKVPEPDPNYQAWLVQINPPIKKKPPTPLDPIVDPNAESPRLTGYTDDTLNPETPLEEYEPALRWGFLLPPNAISYSGTSNYVENNPLFGRIPYVRFNHCKALRITISNVRLITPCNQYDLLPLIISLDELRYPPKYIAPPDAELPVDSEETDPIVTPDQIEQVYARFPGGQYPPGYPGASTGQAGGQFPGNNESPTDSQYPGGMGIPGGNQGQPGGSQGRPPGGGQSQPGTEIPIEEPVTDIEDEADKELEEEIEGIEPIEDPRIIDPPMLSLVLGNRTIQPIRLESIQVNENDLQNGLPTDVTLTLQFIAITHPVLYQELLTPDDIIPSIPTPSPTPNPESLAGRNNDALLNSSNTNRDPFGNQLLPSF